MASQPHLPALSHPALAFAFALGFLCSACGEPSAPPDPLGVFVLDRKEMAGALKRQGVPDPVAQTHAGALRVELDLRDDGTFLFRHKAGDEPVEVRSGTWARNGNRIIITSRRIAGQPIEPPVDATALLDGDRLEIQAEDHQPEGKAFTPGYVLVRR